MAARSDAATDRVTLNSAPSVTAVAIGGWFQVNAASAGSFNTAWRLSLSSGDSTTWILAFRGTNGRTPTLYSPSNTTGIVAPEQALDTYVYLCATLSGTSAQLFYGNTPGSLTKVTGTVAASNTPDRFCVFGRSAADATDWLNGTGAYLRVWEAVPSDSEVAAESQASAPVRTANAWANWAFAAAALTDTVAARNLIAGSTGLSSATDPVLGSPTQAGTAVLTLGALGTQQHTVAAAGTSAVTLGATGTQQRVATAAGTAGVALDATGTATTQRAATGTAALTLAATGASTHVATDAGAAALVLAASGTQNRVATTSGLAALTLGGDGAALHVANAASTAALTLLATGVVDSGSAVDAGAALLTLGASGAHSTVRTAIGAAVLVLVATGVTPGDVVTPAGRPRLILQPNRTTVELAGSTTTAALKPNTASLEGVAP